MSIQPRHLRKTLLMFLTQWPFPPGHSLRGRILFIVLMATLPLVTAGCSQRLSNQESRKNVQAEDAELDVDKLQDLRSENEATLPGK